MVADRIHTATREISGVRIRLDWRGRPVIQVQRAMVRMRFAGPDGICEEPHGSSAWHDAGRGDAIDLARYLEAIQVQR